MWRVTRRHRVIVVEDESGGALWEESGSSRSRDASSGMTWGNVLRLARCLGMLVTSGSLLICASAFLRVRDC